MFKDASLSELFIVQDSLAAQAKEIRARARQAVLPIDATILKVKGARLDRVLEDCQVHSIIATLGVGICFANLFAIENLRYGKIIIVSEETEDGRFIRDQVVAFFRRFLSPLLKAGHVFLMPPEGFESKVMAGATHHLVPLQLR